jgi:hypothetical protein
MKYNSVEKLHVHCHLFFIFHYKAVLHLYCHLFFIFHYTKLYVMHVERGDNVHEMQLCVVKYKKEVTMYMKNSSV